MAGRSLADDLERTVAELPRRLKVARTERGVSMRQVAAEAGVGLATVHRAEHAARRLSIEPMLAILRWIERGSR